MIIFEKLRYKNFLSTGNKFTEIDLNRSQSTLIVGQNGAGKSTMLDALAFALFGKPHRNINKPQLVNSINQKGCLVEVEFRIGSSNFKVSRGIKPGIFEIWKNGTLINQSSHAKEYQKILETNILKINHKSFHQVVVLGSSSFIPFMQLSPGHRRNVIEDLLDIGVFSKMNIILKEETAVLREQLKDISYNIDITKNKVETQTKYIADVQQITAQNAASKKSTIDENQKQIQSLTTKNVELSEKVNADQDPLDKKLNKLHDRKQNFLHYNANFQTQMKSITKDAKFYEDNDNCPTCEQKIPDDLRQSKLNTAKEKAKELKEAMDKLVSESDTVEAAIDESNELLKEIRAMSNEIHLNNSEIGRLQQQIDSLQKELNNTSDADLEKANEDLRDIRKTLEDLNDTKMERNEEYSYKLAIAEMLKDTGIKTKIIKQYLPVMNQLVNQYLQVLDFFVHFDLNEEFSETIRSRHRDDFSYDSFSEGEKQRIDLALLFTWRQIAKMKNSVATNLLILDETFDSSLDENGIENLFKILYTLGDDSNIFVISHKGEILDGKFKDKIEFKKDKNFSTIS
jgi:DNA repair exonuclease SbcCD ATPase subunit